VSGEARAFDDDEISRDRLLHADRAFASVGGIVLSTRMYRRILVKPPGVTN
jgi:hypothetical protein